MAQSLAVLYVHLIFSTKDRQPFLTDKPFRENVHAYLGGISNNLGYAPLIVGGVEDHIHLLARLGKSVTLSDWIRDLKSSSTRWIKEQRPELPKFAWQGGYGAFSVAPDGAEAVRRYILDQEEHHRKFSFKDEFRKLMIECGIEPNEAYLWD